MDTLKQTVRHVIEGYAGEAHNGHLYLTTNPEEDLFTIVGVGEINGKRFVTTGLLVRIEGNCIIVECDLNDKIVLDALLQAGIPRSQIILAYAGETCAEAV